MRLRRGIALRLSALVLSATGLVLAAVVAVSYVLAREALLQSAETNAKTLAQSLVNRIEAVLTPIPPVVRGTVYALEDGELTDEGIVRRQRRMLTDNDAVFGTSVSFEPFGHKPGERYFASYMFRTPLGFKTTHLGSDSYRYHYMDWYQLPRELDRLVWSEPYFDRGGGDVLMTTCAMPFHRMENGRPVVAGVVTSDVSLEWLTRLVAGVSVLDTGYAYLISKSGTYITHPEPDVAFNETIFSRAEEFNDPQLRRIGQDMIHGGSRFVRVRSLHARSDGFLVYAPLPSTGWSLAVFFPRDELLARVHRQAMISAGLGGGGFLALALIVAFIARGITRPLRRLTAAAGEVAGGNLKAELPALTSHDEVAELAESFANMQQSLRRHIRELTEATASRERMESELRIAHDIQMGILPKIFPPFPNRPEIDLFAGLTPAREVGGDFYDFFPCGEDRFCFLVGDVSGKGVPAAFYMAVAKTLIKAVAESASGGRRSGEERAAGDAGAARRQGPDPGRILARASNDLAQDNESCMFVTIFCAVLDMRTGKVRMASAGHNPPVLLRAAAGTAEYLPTHGDPVAGALPGVEYATDELTLAPGDAILLYTDGVTEAMNPAQELFGEDRLLARARRLTGQSARQVCEDVRAEVAAYAAGAEQSDDITLLTLRYVGAGANAGEIPPGDTNGVPEK